MHDADDDGEERAQIVDRLDPGGRDVDAPEYTAASWCLGPLVEDRPTDST
jgi:hypothetical protein